jgi:hypothetical protein
MRSIKTHYARFLADEKAALIRAVHHQSAAKPGTRRRPPAKGDPPS